MKKFGKRLLYIILALAIVHGIATLILKQEIATRLNAYQQDRGDSPVIVFGPDAENGALLYQKAFGLMWGKNGVDISGDILKPDERARRPELWSQTRTTVARHKNVFPLIEKAAAMPQCLLPPTCYFNSNNQVIWHYYANMKRLTQLLCADALIQSKDGNAEGATKSLALAFKVSESLKDEPLLIGLLVRIAIARVATDTLQDICLLTDLNENQMLELDRILGSMDFSRGYEKALQSERGIVIKLFSRLSSNPFYMSDTISKLDPTSAEKKKWDKLKPLGGFISWVWRPALYADEMVYLNHIDKLTANGSKPYRESLSFLQTEPHTPVYAVISRNGMPFFAQSAKSVATAKASVSGSRLFLALLMHKKRTGQYPNSLDELQGLENKIDPFSDKEFVYKRQGKGFLLYSIGEDMKDDKARPWTTPPTYDRPSPPKEYRYTNAKGQPVADIVWEMDR